MSLSDLASLGSFVSGLAVLVSLVYLALQTRQNVKHTRALLNQASGERGVNLFLARAMPDAARVWVAENDGAADPSKVQSEQFNNMCAAIYINWDGVFAQHQDGLLEGESFERITSGLIDLLGAPKCRQFFEAVSGSGSNSKFHAYLRDCLAKA